MKRVTGLGGVFFKSPDPEALYSWYERHLGLKRESDGSAVVFPWKPIEEDQPTGMTVWSIFEQSSNYFEPTTAEFMVNYRVEDIDGLLNLLRAEGVEIDAKREDTPYGRFAWIRDPEGRRIELWEPPAAE
jgi:predicted enzyme related to lactoylglutathione lyase